jgi:hypothetical protein
LVSGNILSKLNPLENYNYLWDDVWLIKEREDEATPGSELPSTEDQ